MFDTSLIGSETQPLLQEVERGAVLRFVEAIGDPHPLYRDVDAARAAGHRDLVAPPTFPVTFRPAGDLLATAGVDMRRLLHGEQTFEYVRPLCVGDRLLVRARISDVFEKPTPAGPLRFIVVEDEGRDEDGRPIYRGRRSYYVR